MNLIKSVLSRRARPSDELVVVVFLLSALLLVWMIVWAVDDLKERFKRKRK